ncbi:MAG: thiamine-phosphate kinase, partial [Parvibaculum sp.]
DYEILFAAPPEKAGEVNAVAAETGVGVTRIGKLVDAQCGIVALDGEGCEIPLPKAGYRHF